MKKEKKYCNSSNLESTDTDDLGKGKRSQKRSYETDSSDDDNVSQQFILPTKQVCEETPENVQQFQNNSMLNKSREQPPPRLQFPEVPSFKENPVQHQAEYSFTLSSTTSVPNEQYEVIKNAPVVPSVCILFLKIFLSYKSWGLSYMIFILKALFCNSNMRQALVLHLRLGSPLSF